jgi:hypothetical protein
MLASRSYTMAHQHGRGTDPADAEDALVFKGVRLVSEIATYDWSGGTPVMVALVPDVAEGVGLWFGHDMLEAHARFFCLCFFGPEFFRA